MWRLNGPAATWLVASLAFLLALSLIFAFRDTRRALAEFFDVRAIRRLRKTPRAATAIAVAFVATAVYVGLHVDPGEFLMALSLVFLLVVPGLCLAWIVLSDVVEAIRNRRRP